MQYDRPIAAISPGICFVAIYAAAHPSKPFFFAPKTRDERGLDAFIRCNLA
jgi:hypothetical protein